MDPYMQLGSIIPCYIAQMIFGIYLQYFIFTSFNSDVWSACDPLDML